MNDNTLMDLIMARIGIGLFLLVLVGLGVACAAVGLRGLWQLLSGRII